MKFSERIHWVFDLDNTLADSAIDFTAIRTALGLPATPILEEIETRPPAEAARLHRRLAELERDYALKATPLDGAQALLELLVRRKATLGILTRNSRANALDTLDVCRLSEFFDPAHVLGRDEAAPKPDPEGILTLLKAWGATPTTAVMVGDYRYDLEAGRRAGVATVYYDATQKNEWTDQADARVQSHAELINLIQKEAPCP